MLQLFPNKTVLPDRIKGVKNLILDESQVVALNRPDYLIIILYMNIPLKFHVRFLYVFIHSVKLMFVTKVLILYSCLNFKDFFCDGENRMMCK